MEIIRKDVFKRKIEKGEVIVRKIKEDEEENFRRAYIIKDAIDTRENMEGFMICSFNYDRAEYDEEKNQGIIKNGIRSIYEFKFEPMTEEEKIEFDKLENEALKEQERVNALAKEYEFKKDNKTIKLKLRVNRTINGYLLQSEITRSDGIHTYPAAHSISEETHKEEIYNYVFSIFKEHMEDIEE